MYCTHCGQEIPNESQFCFSCGQKVKPVVRKTAAQDAAEPTAMRPVAAHQEEDTSSVMNTSVEESKYQDNSFDQDSEPYSETVKEVTVPVDGSMISIKREQWGLRIAGLAQIGMILLWASTFVLDSMGVPVTADAENIYLMLLIIILGIEILSFLICGGRRVWAWITGGFRKMVWILLIPICFPIFLTVGVLWLTFASLFIIMVPILPVYLTYRNKRDEAAMYLHDRMSEAISG